MPASQISKPIFLYAAAQQAFRLAHRDCAIRLARSKIRRAPLSDYLKIAIACAHRITPFVLAGAHGVYPARQPLPPYYPRRGIPARVSRCVCRLYGAYTPRILPTAGDGAAVNACPGGCVALCARCMHHIGRPSASPAITRRQTADGNTCRASSAGRVHRTAGHPRALVSVKPRQAVKRAGAGCRVSGAVIL